VNIQLPKDYCESILISQFPADQLALLVDEFAKNHFTTEIHDDPAVARQAVLNKNYALVLLYIQQMDSSLFDIMFELAMLPDGMRTTVIVVAPHENEFLIGRCYAYGASAVFTKNFSDRKSTSQLLSLLALSLDLDVRAEVSTEYCVAFDQFINSKFQNVTLSNRQALIVNLLIRTAREQPFTVHYHELPHSLSQSNHLALQSTLEQIIGSEKSCTTDASLTSDTFVVFCGSIGLVIVANQFSCNSDCVKRLIGRLYTNFGWTLPAHVLLGSASSTIFPSNLNLVTQARLDVRSTGVFTRAMANPTSRVGLGRLRLRERELLSRMGTAVSESKLSMFYQAKFELDTRRAIGFEALVRWFDPDLGWISPAEFIPLAEERNFISLIDRWVFNAVFKQVEAWISAGELPLFQHVAINVSLSHVGQPDFLAYVKSLVKQYPSVDLRTIQFELTETARFSSRSTLVKNIKSLSKMGFKIVLDDFGLGYATFELLELLEVDGLKLDRSFIQEIETSLPKQNLIRSLKAFAAEMGLPIVFEGVETQAQCEILSSLNCKFGQGYLVSKPSPPDQVIKKFSQ